MAMDLQELQKALDAVRVSRPRRGKLYVDSYVKAWYFEEEGLMRWIADNYESYHARHMTALVLLLRQIAQRLDGIDVRMDEVASRRARSAPAPRPRPAPPRR